MRWLSCPYYINYGLTLTLDRRRKKYITINVPAQTRRAGSPGHCHPTRVMKGKGGTPINYLQIDPLASMPGDHQVNSCDWLYTIGDDVRYRFCDYYIDRNHDFPRGPRWPCI